jgi:hypothetical protein
MTTLVVRAVGMCAPGFDGWERARPVLAGEQPFAAEPMPAPVAAGLPVTERRRANATSRLALVAARDATRGFDAQALCALRSVFASSDGDGEVLATVLRELAQDAPMLSPTTFHNSVFNAPAGYWSIAAHAEAASTTICGGRATFAVGLLEAAAQAATGEPTLLVAYDHPFPADAPIRSPADAPFACALVLERVGTCTPNACATLSGWHIDSRTGTAARPEFAMFAGNAAAAAMPLLGAVASASTLAVTLPLGADDALTVEVQCC